MKLAEALILRADCQKRMQQLETMLWFKMGRHRLRIQAN